MTSLTTGTVSFAPATETAAHLFDNWFDPIESGVRGRVREFIEELIQCELDDALARPRYRRAKDADRRPTRIAGHRHGSRTRSLTGSFGRTEITVPRARLQTGDGKTTEWYAKPPFGGPKQVLAYLGRYTHRVAIANSRLISLSDGKVRGAEGTD
jgi:putative transposase